jgi:hypothetical protein
MPELLDRDDAKHHEESQDINLKSGNNEITFR